MRATRPISRGHVAGGAEVRVRVRARRISLFAFFLGAVAPEFGCQIIAGIEDISLVPGDAGGQSHQESGGPPAYDGSLDSMVIPLSDHPTAPPPADVAPLRISGDPIPPAGAP